MAKYYKTKITVTVLSEKPYHFDNLHRLSYDVIEGDCVGSTEKSESEEVPEKEMIKLLFAAGSEPEFFGIEMEED